MTSLAKNKYYDFKVKHIYYSKYTKGVFFTLILHLTTFSIQMKTFFTFIFSIFNNATLLLFLFMFGSTFLFTLFRIVRDIPYNNAITLFLTGEDGFKVFHEYFNNDDYPDPDPDGLGMHTVELLKEYLEHVGPVSSTKTSEYKYYSILRRSNGNF